MSQASRGVLSRFGLRPSGMYENRGVSVLPFFKYRAFGYDRYFTFGMAVF